jgi:hypothetical protein
MATSPNLESVTNPEDWPEELQHLKPEAARAPDNPEDREYARQQ